MNKQELKLLAETRRQQKLLDKRIARLETLEFGSLAGGCWTEIETITVPAGAGVPNVNFQGIPQIYLHLAMIISARTSANVCSSIKVFFNSDEGENYWYNIHRLNGATGAPTHSCSVVFGIAAFASYIGLGRIPGASFGFPELFSDIYNSENLWIPDYRCPYKKKSCHWDNETLCADAEEISADKFRELGGGFWHSVVAINEIDVSIVGAGNFTQNSKFSLYGIGGTYECFA